MKLLLYLGLLVVLAFAGWSASGGYAEAGFVWLATTDTTTPDPTPTETTVTTDATVTTTSTDSTTTDTTATTTTESTTTASTILLRFRTCLPATTVEANGPGGSLVNYTAPTAVDDNDGARPVVCSPASGSLFPLGGTTVTCTATDSADNQAQATFLSQWPIRLRPPCFVPAPHRVYATSALGITDSDPAVGAFVQAANATDIVDPHPVVRSDLHAFLPRRRNRHRVLRTRLQRQRRHARRVADGAAPASGGHSPASAAGGRGASAECRQPVAGFARRCAEPHLADAHGVRTSRRHSLEQRR